MTNAVGYEVRKVAWGYGRWHVIAVLDGWPHDRLVVKCTTKREASLIVDCLNSRQFTRENVEWLVREYKRRHPGPSLASLATHHIHMLFDLVGLGCPEWWREVYEDLLANKEPT